MMRFSSPLSFALFVLVAASIPLPAPLAAGVITVDSTCTLAAAIAAANADAPVGGCPAGSGADTIALTVDVALGAVENSTDGPNGLPSVQSKIEIAGGDFTVFRESGAPPFRIFHIGELGELTIYDLVVLNGRIEGVYGGGGIFVRGRLVVHDGFFGGNAAISADSPVAGGGIRVASGSIELHRTAVLQNSAESTRFSANGGGIAVDEAGSLVIEDSFIFENVAEGLGGGSAFGGGMVLRGSAEISRSLIAGNIVSGRAALGGGVYSPAAAEIVNSTFCDNEAIGDVPDGSGFLGAGRIRQTTFHGNVGGGATLSSTSRESVTISGVLLAKSGAAHCAGDVIDAGGNLADDTDCLPTIAGTLTGLESVLGDNGGGTLTFALDPSSNAIDLAGECGVERDQRGAGRFPPCDSGAFEEIDCPPLLELKNQTIDDPLFVTGTCNTALLGPDLIIAADEFVVVANHSFVLKDGVEVVAGSRVTLILGPEPVSP